MESQNPSHLFCKNEFSDAEIRTSDGHTIPIHKNIVFEQAPFMAQMFTQYRPDYLSPHGLIHDSPFDLKTMATVLGSLYHNRLWMSHIYSCGVANGAIRVLPETEQHPGSLGCSFAVAHLAKYTKAVDGFRYYEILGFAAQAEQSFETELRKNWDINVLYEVMDTEWIRQNGSYTFTSEIPGILRIAARVAADHAPSLLASNSFLERHFSVFAHEVGQALANKVDNLHSELTMIRAQGHNYEGAARPEDPFKPKFMPRQRRVGGYRRHIPHKRFGNGSSYHPDAINGARSQGYHRTGLPGLAPIAPRKIGKQRAPRMTNTETSEARLAELQKLQNALEKKNQKEKKHEDFVHALQRALKQYNEKGQFCNDCAEATKVSVMIENDGQLSLTCTKCNKRLGMFEA